jgi:peptidoglycan/LPS O-acetylase OafA/YrhL
MPSASPRISSHECYGAVMGEVAHPWLPSRRVTILVGCLSIAWAAWLVIARHYISPFLWTAGPFMLLALVPTNRLPRLVRDLEYKAQMAGGLGVFGVGLVLDLTPILVGGIIPRGFHKLTLVLAVLGIVLMIVGLVTSRLGLNVFFERHLASPKMQRRLEEIERRRRQR